MAIPAGEALFAVGGVVDEESGYVTVHNSTPIDFYERRRGSKGCESLIQNCPHSRPFQIVYEDTLGMKWEVEVASATWSP